ncbi:hypothetical protein B0H17DRAFT_1005912 [Mycena rosella]|uniref:RING-type domain-containing protein n=1 Tax=Mycena rosella TaxID=1033263 RepID=A0AAD7GNZ6_MYCRO|nr:hypothetical protein B0H17DRAFT_1005912 [Mycena rosella]
MDLDPLASVKDRIAAFLESLPTLSKDVLDPNDCCPICLSSFEALLTDEATSAAPNDECGVTKLNCGHIFCRKDLLEWIRNLHGSCPTCRDLFLDIHPPGSDDESSDGGEYVPDDDDDDEQDAFIETSDGFTEGDYEMDLDSDDIWEGSDGDEMQINAESEPSSEGDDHDEALAVQVDVSIADDDSSDEIQAEEPK